MESRMTTFLIADAESARSFWGEHWRALLPVAVGFVAIYLLLPRVRRSRPVIGGALAATAVILGATLLLRMDVSIESLLFFAFAGSAIIGGVMMISQKNPVHAALSFALVVLSTCGLFLLQAAPFLMAATIIVYAGAIVVTFLFVIMLAQQEGASSADQRSREPFLASLAGCVLLAALLCVLHKTYETREFDSVLPQLKALTDAKDEADIKRILGDPKTAKVGQSTPPLVGQLQELFSAGPISVTTANLQTHWARMDVPEILKTSRALLAAVEAKRQEHGCLKLYDVPGKKDTPGHVKTPGTLPAGNVAALGKTLFSDYLVPVELAATLLLVATIGAIAIAGRRSEELR